MKFSAASVVIGAAALAATARALSLADAIQALPQFSNFSALLRDHPDLAASLNPATTSDKRTVLVPDNSAFQKQLVLTGSPVSSLPVSKLQDLFSYHTLVGALGPADFSTPTGLTVATFLTGEVYNNRSAGAQLNSIGSSSASHAGQVLVITTRQSSNSKREFSVRQANAPSQDVTSGLARKVNLTALDITWDGGKIQMVDGFLTLPEVCTKTIRAWELTSLDASLNRTSLATALDHLKNVTCLGPSDQAFKQAGSPDVNARVADLTTALLFHTLSQPVYTPFLKDGQTFQTLTNDTVMVSMRNGSIYFNNAKLIQPNVITNNGLMHIIDSVMAPLSTGTPTPTKSGAAPSQSKASGAAQALVVPSQMWNVLGLFSFAAVALLW